MHSRRRFRIRASAASLACLAVAAMAQQDEPVLRLRISQQLTRDSNLFRLPAAADRLALLGADSAADTVGVTTLGLSLKKEVSLQRFEIDVAWVDYRYRHFRYLDFVGSSYRLAWLWRVTPDLQGTLSDQRARAPSDFTDQPAYGRRNVATSRTTRLEAAYAVDGRWSLLGGLARAEQTSQVPLAAEGDVLTHTTEVGVLHAWPSGADAAWRWRRSHGRYPLRVLDAALQQDDHFEQREHEWRLRWEPAAGLRTDANLGHVRRWHPNFPQRDYGGLQAGLIASWDVTAQTRLGAGWSRERASYQAADANYTLSDRLVLEPSWQIGARSALRLRVERSQRDYLGAPQALGDTPARSDTGRDTALIFDWQPIRSLNVNATLRSSRRASNRPGLDYRANQVGLSAQYDY